MRPLRIAFVSLHTSPLDAPGSKDAGGMNVVEMSQARALGARGHRVDLLTRRDNPDLPEIVDVAPGVRVRLLDVGPAIPLAKSAQEEWIGAFGERMSQLAPYDLVHSQHWMSGVAAIPVARAWGVPHVQSYHSVAAPVDSPLSEGEPPESPGRLAGERFIAARSDAVVAVSEYEADTIVQRCGADRGRVRVIRPGVDSELFHPLPEGVPDADDYVLFAGRLQPLKAPDLALRAVAEIPPDLRPTLVVAGETSQDFAGYRDELMALAGELGIAGRTRWLGSQTRGDLARLLRGARIVLMPSFSETFGLVTLEAAASGVGVVASAAGGLVEAVRDGVTGVLVEEHTPAAWGRVLGELLRDPQRLAAMGRAGRRYALEHGWDANAAGLESLYDALLGNPGAHPQPFRR